MAVKVPEPVVVMPAKPIQSAVTVPVLKLSVVVPVLTVGADIIIGLDAVPAPKELADVIVCVPAGNCTAVPGGKVSEA